MRNFNFQALISTEVVAVVLAAIIVVGVITIFFLGWNYWNICQQERALQRRRR